MEQDFGYVKVRRGPLFPSKWNEPPHNNHQTEFKRHPPMYYSSRYLKPKYAEHTTSTYDDHFEQTYPDGIGLMQSSGYTTHNNMDCHFHPRDYRYPEIHSMDNLIQRRKKQLIRPNQVQRSTSFYSPSYQRPFINEDDKKRPDFPQPDYGHRSRSVNPQQRVSQESRKSNSVDSQHRFSHEGRIGKGLYKVHGRECKKDISFDAKNTSDNVRKPFIPKPDYTWHRKK